MDFTTLSDLDLSPRELMKRLLEIVQNNSDSTLRNYYCYFRMVKIDPFDYAEFSVSNPRKIEAYLLDWRDKYAKSHAKGGRTIRQVLSTLKHCSDFCGGNQIRWKILTSGIPKGPKGEDTEIPIEAIRKIHEGGDKRLRFLNTLFFSGGIRAGALFYYARSKARWDYLRVKDLSVINEFRIGKLVIYRDDPDCYIPFITPESLEAWEEYRNERQNQGDAITPESPLLCAKKGDRFGPMTVSALKAIYYCVWNNAGYDLAHRTWHSIHGFRKSHKTRLEDTDMKSIHIEALQGRPKGTDQNYYRPSEVMKRAEIYSKHMSVLFIEEKYNLKSELEKEKEISQKTYRDLQTDLILANQRIERNERDTEELKAELRLLLGKRKTLARAEFKGG